MKSMGRYIHRRIPTQKGKDAYRDAMRECIKIIEAGHEHLSYVKDSMELLLSPHLLDLRFRKSWFNSKLDERHHYCLAVWQAQDIVKTIEARFITGTGDLIPRGYEGKGTIYEYDPTLFGET